MNSVKTQAYGPPWHGYVIGLLAAILIACGIVASNASSDTHRDIFFAQQIASGEFFPLTGPAINAALHLGPLWYYLLAPVMWIFQSSAAVTGLVCAIAASQFPLGYLLARRYGTPREAILFVFALALPGFMDVQLGWLTHTAAVVPSLMLGVFAALAYRKQPDVKHALLLGLALTFMLCAHPTLAFFGGLLVVWCALRSPGWLVRFQHAAIVLTLLALSIAPMLYDQWRTGFADTASATEYVKNEWTLPSLTKAYMLLHAVLVNGPKYIARFWLNLSPSAARPLLGVYALIIVSAFVGLGWRVLYEPQRRRLICMLLALLFAQAIFVCMVRDVQPPWMMFALWPIIAALIALGLESICRSRERFLVAAGLSVTTIWSLAAWAHFAAGKREMIDIKASPGKHGSYDIRDYEKTKYEIYLPRIPYRQIFSIATPLCRPVTLYGHYAYFIDISYAVGAMHYCGGADTIRLGGMPESTRASLLGLHQNAWRKIGMLPTTQIGVLGIVEPNAVWTTAQQLTPVVPLFTNFPRVIKDAATRYTVEGDARADEAIAISNRVFRNTKFEVISAQVDGRAVQPAYADFVTAVFIVPADRAATGKQHWRFEIEGLANYIDVVSFVGASQSKESP